MHFPPVFLIPLLTFQSISDFSPKYESFLENKAEDIMMGKRISGMFLDHEFLKQLCFDLGVYFLISIFPD